MPHENDPVIKAIKSGNNQNIHRSISDSSLYCENLQAYIRIGIEGSNAFVVYQLINRIEKDRFSKDFVNSSVVSEILTEACQRYAATLNQPPHIQKAALQVIDVIISQIDHLKIFCLTASQLQPYFNVNSMDNLDAATQQKRGRYYRCIYWAQALSLRIEADKRYTNHVVEQSTLKRVLTTFVNELHGYLNVVSKEDLDHEQRYLARINAFEKFMETVDKAYVFQKPDVFIVTVQNAIATARATISNDANQNTTIDWIASYTGFSTLTGYTSSRCSNVLSRVQDAFRPPVANNSNFAQITCRQQSLATGTSGSPSTGKSLAKRGY